MAMSSIGAHKGTLNNNKKKGNLMKTIIKSVALTSLLAAGTVTASDSTSLTSAQLSPAQPLHIADLKREAASYISNHADIFTASVTAELSVNNLAVQLDQLSTNKQLQRHIDTLNVIDDRMIAHKGIGRYEQDILEIRLADESMLPAVKRGQSALFAWEPAGDESTWTHIEAFDASGSIHYLSTEELPQQPVFVIDINQSKSIAAGVKVMQSVLAKKGMTQAVPQDRIESSIAVTTLDKIRLNDDQEPWISGKAEIYGVVTGIDPSRDEPHLDIVDMPYLDHDEKTYYPGQVVIYWDRYRYQAADLLLMEHDDNTNYQTIITGLLDIATQALNTFGQPEFAAITYITSQIISLFPGSWFTNDDDYVDVFYTLRKGYSYTNKNGASANAKADFRPLTIQSN